MKIAVIGGGFTGLSAAVKLLEDGHTPVIFEAGSECGGLARGFNPGNWKWNLEIFYHHIFTNDKDIIDLAKKVGRPMVVKHPVTTSFLKNKEIVLDSPLSLLRFSGMSLPARLQMGFGLFLLKLIPNGLFLEKYKATTTLPKLLGSEGYKIVWEKLLKAKFGPYVDEVNMAWFWSRVAKRTKNLGYFEKGFSGLIDNTVEYIKQHGGVIRLKTPVEKIELMDKAVTINGERFDAAILTLPAPKSKKLFSEISIPELNYLWGQTLILEVSKKLIQGYWMNILEENYPFLVAVEHTNMIDKKNYGDNRILYLGNYLPEGHKQLQMSADQLLKLYLPYLTKINKLFNRRAIKKIYLFREPFAQPVFPVNYSKMIPAIKLRDRLYMANMSMVYPFDRGTNYAVRAGVNVVNTVLKDLK